MDVETLRKILEKLPDDYNIYFRNIDIEKPINETIEIDISAKKLVLK